MMKLRLSQSFILLYLLSSSSSVSGAGFNIFKQKESSTDTAAYMSPFYKENDLCFKCHGQGRYEYTNENLGRQVKALMFSEMIIDRTKFYTSNHKSFKCTDCHSADYSTFPHPGELRMEEKFNCIDCHGGDEKFARFKFEEIESEYEKSVHYELSEEGYTCWKCHGPHDYKINIRNSINLKETILYDNNICLNCHANYDHFQVLSEREEINVLDKHNWLPDQKAHFRNVRCIECHSEVNDSILVSHLINPKEKAVKMCNECHSRNSLLMSSLYKFKSKEQRRDGFLNGIILNESFVIGANRNEYLNIISTALYAILILVIGTHLCFRIFKK